MDPMALAGMIFSLLVILIIAGSVLAFPLVGRLGKLLELRIEQGREGAIPEAELEELRRTVESLEAEVRLLSERQQFTERLLEAGSGEAGKGAG